MIPNEQVKSTDHINQWILGCRMRILSFLQSLMKQYDTHCARKALDIEMTIYHSCATYNEYQIAITAFCDILLQCTNRTSTTKIHDSQKSQKILSEVTNTFTLSPTSENIEKFNEMICEEAKRILRAVKPSSPDPDKVSDENPSIDCAKEIPGLQLYAGLVSRPTSIPRKRSESLPGSLFRKYLGNKQNARQNLNPRKYEPHRLHTNSDFSPPRMDLFDSFNKESALHQDKDAITDKMKHENLQRLKDNTKLSCIIEQYNLLELNIPFFTAVEYSLPEWKSLHQEKESPAKEDQPTGLLVTDRDVVSMNQTKPSESQVQPPRCNLDRWSDLRNKNKSNFRKASGMSAPKKIEYTSRQLNIRHEKEHILNVNGEYTQDGLKFDFGAREPYSQTSMSIESTSTRSPTELGSEKGRISQENRTSPDTCRSFPYRNRSNNETMNKSGPLSSTKKLNSCARDFSILRRKIFQDEVSQSEHYYYGRQHCSFTKLWDKSHSSYNRHLPLTNGHSQNYNFRPVDNRYKQVYRSRSPMNLSRSYRSNATGSNYPSSGPRSYQGRSFANTNFPRYRRYQSIPFSVNAPFKPNINRPPNSTFTGLPQRVPDFRQKIAWPVTYDNHHHHHQQRYSQLQSRVRNIGGYKRLQRTRSSILPSLTQNRFEWTRSEAKQTNQSCQQYPEKSNKSNQTTESNSKPISYQQIWEHEVNAPLILKQESWRSRFSQENRFTSNRENRRLSEMRTESDSACQLSHFKRRRTLSLLILKRAREGWLLLQRGSCTTPENVHNPIPG
ncbi:hypothetical protein ACOME3_000914 [Neoechinorhynchus agilis]